MARHVESRKAARGDELPVPLFAALAVWFAREPVFCRTQPVHGVQNLVQRQAVPDASIRSIGYVCFEKSLLGVWRKREFEDGGGQIPGGIHNVRFAAAEV